MRIGKPALILGLAGAAPVAPAQEPGEDRPSVFDWEVQVEPRVWFAATSGDLRLPGSTEEVTFADLDLDEPGLRPGFEVQFHRDPWRITVSGFFLDEQATTTPGFGGSVGGLTFSPTDVLRSSVSQWSLDVSGGYVLHRYRGEPDGRGAIDVASDLEVIGGVRTHAADIDVSLSGASPMVTTGDSQFFAEPFAGIRWTLDLYEQLTLEAEGNVGGFAVGDHSSISLDLGASIAWRPIHNMGVHFGYRQLAYSLSDGDGPGEFSLFGAVAGLYAGLSLRF
ncbi:MAG: hypothetical protein H6811_07440 [Phycisphaeraceae bacterium]|nr:hypothetical protein [Phycisphaeraceae bacterium]